MQPPAIGPATPVNQTTQPLEKPSTSRSPEDEVYFLKLQWISSKDEAERSKLGMQIRRSLTGTKGSAKETSPHKQPTSPASAGKNDRKPNTEKPGGQETQSKLSPTISTKTN
jgi:hypothetical protein